MLYKSFSQVTLILSLNIANDNHQYHRSKVYDNSIMTYISSVLSIRGE